MKNSLTSKSQLSRLCVMFFILLCSVFTSKNASSITWKESYSEAFSDNNDNFIIIKIQTYNDDGNEKAIFNYLKELQIEFCEKGKVFTPLLNSNVNYQGRRASILAEIRCWKDFSNISFPKCEKIGKGTSFQVEMKMEPLDAKGNKLTKQTKVAFLIIKWDLPQYFKSIKSVKLSGKWCEISDMNTHLETFSKTCTVNYSRLVKKDRKDSNNNVKVSNKADIITVTGVNSGEKIKIYNADTKAEVKSVIAPDDVVKIRLPKGHLYLIQIGQKSHKVAL